jgi:thiamine pyrophosphate-dependent acetolactate synthase large subunit-like protein
MNTSVCPAMKVTVLCEKIDGRSHPKVSGRTQVVPVHAELGTQQVGGAIQQAWWGRIPVVLCTGNMVSPGRLNWRKEPYDPGAMARNCVKWDHEVGANESFYEVLNQAFQIADSDPKGPVHLNNRAYGAIRMLFQGDWKEGVGNSLICSSPDYAVTAQARGAYGRKVEDPEDVPPALKEAFAQIRQGRTAVLDVRAV